MERRDEWRKEKEKHAHPILILIKPLHKRQHIPRDAAHETQREERVARGGVARVPVVDDRGDADADEPGSKLALLINMRSRAEKTHHPMPT
jgi:hypothetical protein